MDAELTLWSSPALPAIELIVKATLALAIAGLGASLLRRAPAASRHLLWTVALASVVLLPALTRLPDVTVPLPAVVAAWFSSPTPLPATPVTKSAAPVSWPNHTPLAVTKYQPPVVVQNRPVAVVAAAPVFSWFAALLTIWAVGCAAVLLRLGLGMVRAFRIASRGDVAVSSQLEALTQRLGIGARVQLIVSREIDVPMTCGLWRSRLLVPVAFWSWSAMRRELVLVHELAHIRRRDCLTQLVGQLACALYWFHPLVWYVDRGLRREAEQAADDVVLNLGMRASDYAAHLLAIVRSLSRPTRVSSIATVSMAGTSFEARVRAILESNRKRGPMPRATKLLVAVPLLGAVALLGAVKVVATPPEPTPKQAATLHEEATVPLVHTIHALVAQAHRDAYHFVTHLHDGAADSPGETAFQDAYELYRHKSFAAAADGFRKAIDLSYRPATAMYNLACCHALLGQNDQAIEWLGRAIEGGFAGSEIETDSDLHTLRNDDRFRSLLDDYRARLRAMVARGEDVDDVFSDTMAELSRLESDKSNDGDEWYDVGMSLHRLGQWDQAITAWNRALEFGADRGKTVYNLACVSARQGAVDDAFQKLAEAVQYGYGDPDYLDEDSDLDSIRDDKRYQEIRNEAELLELPDTNYGDSSYRAFLAPSWANAAKRYETYLSSHPNSGRAWFNLGFASLATDQLDRAVDCFERSFKLDFWKVKSAYNVACSYARLNDKDRAFEWLDKARELSDGELLMHMFGDADLDNLRDDPRFPDAGEFERHLTESIDAEKVEKMVRKAMAKAEKAMEKAAAKRRSAEQN